MQKTPKRSSQFHRSADRSRGYQYQRPEWKVERRNVCRGEDDEARKVPTTLCLHGAVVRPASISSIFAPPNFAFLGCKFYRNKRGWQNDGGEGCNWQQRWLILNRHSTYKAPAPKSHATRCIVSLKSYNFLILRFPVPKIKVELVKSAISVQFNNFTIERIRIFTSLMTHNLKQLILHPILFIRMSNLRVIYWLIEYYLCLMIHFKFKLIYSAALLWKKTFRNEIM